MDGRNIEPRTVLWAVAEVWWEDPAGKPFRAAATLEDTSLSGACIRLKTPSTLGSRLTVKWHREQFSAVARNGYSDGREFLLGVRREPALSSTEFTASETVVPVSNAADNILPVAPAMVEPTLLQPKMELGTPSSLRDPVAAPIAARCCAGLACERVKRVNQVRERPI